MNFFKKIISIFLATFLFLSFSPAVYADNENIILAGGCFWCLEHDLEDLTGVYSVDSGYSGGSLSKPTYKNHQGHQEVVIVNYNPELISLDRLLRAYWRNIDPFDAQGQFCDRGNSYSPVIFAKNQFQLDQAQSSLQKAAKELSVPIEKIMVEIRSATEFWIAEEYHQDFAEKNNIKYNFYRYSCGRDKRLKEIWGSANSSDTEWRNHK